MTVTPGLSAQIVPTLDPITGRFPDRFVPQKMVDDLAASQAAKDTAVAASTTATGAASDAQASKSAAAASATAAAGSATTANQSKSDAANSASAAISAKQGAETAYNGAVGSATQAISIAQSVRDDANAGLFKGEPGGLVMGTLIPDGADLQTYLTPGTYRKVGGTVLNGPTGIRQPYFTMLVLAAEPGRVQQIIYPAASGQGGRVFWMNSKAGTTWSGWHSFGASYTETTVGRAHYQWDTQSDTYRLIAGSTGDISLAGILLPGITATTITVSRQDDLVTLNVRGLTVAVSGSQNIFTSFPVGFRPASTQELRVPIGVGLNPVVRLIQVNGPNTWYSGANTADLLSFQVTYRTNDSWPTATPPPPQLDLP